MNSHQRRKLRRSLGATPISREEFDAIFGCVDCGVNTADIDEYPYMLSDEMWASIGMGYRGMLCVACCEGRLGRPLVPADIVAGIIPKLQQLFKSRAASCMTK